jgi:protein-ribulosamine 3-kinase
MKPGPTARRIAQSIADATREDFEATATERVGGGCIHEAWKLTGETAGGTVHYFAKTNAVEAKAMFEAEAEGLAALRSAAALRVPHVVARDDDGERAWLVLEWLELAAITPAAGATLGDALAAQHRMAQAHFGWPRDNFIGATRQRNTESDDWLGFWRAHRLVPQLELAARNRLPSKMIDRGERLAADCDALFSSHKPGKSLLHGDLWSGNVSTLADGTPAVFDPAVYVGDRECDLAMTQLFGGFPPDFQAAYVEAWPLADSYNVRRDFYNLYHVLNHANLFGGGYVAQGTQSIERLLAEIG